MHAKHIISALFALTFSDETRRVSMVQSSGIWAKALRLGAGALQGSQRVQRRRATKQGWNSTLQRRIQAERVCTSAPRLGLSAPSSASPSPHWAAADAPFTLTHWYLPDRDGCAHTRTQHTHTCMHTQQGAPTVPLVVRSCAEGEKLDQFEQRGKRWQADGSSAPIQRGWRCGWEGEGGGARGVLYMTIIRFLHKSQKVDPVSVN